VAQRAVSGDQDCRLALEVVAHRLVKYGGGYAAVMGLLDAVVFTGGIGENAAGMSAAVLQGFGDLQRRRRPRCQFVGSGQWVITEGNSRVTGLVVPTNEELQIACECVDALLHRGPSAPGTTAPDS
jgi:acetate kinase